MTNREYYDKLIHAKVVQHKKLAPSEREWLDYYVGIRQTMTWDAMQQLDNEQIQAEAMPA